MLRKLIFTLGLVLAAMLVFGGSYLSSVLSAGSGFSAKNICSGYFLSGMPGQQIIDEILAPTAPVLSNISFEIDKRNRWVDTRFFGLSQRRAVFTEGTGCTLLRAGREQLQRKLEVAGFSQPDAALPWPQGSAPAPVSSKLEPVLEQAFAEPDPLNLRHTKAVVVIHKGRMVAEKYAPEVDGNTPLPGWSMSQERDQFVDWKVDE